MFTPRLRTLALAASAAVALAGCTDYYGDGYGYGYSRPYSYGSSYYGTPYRSYSYGYSPYSYSTPYYGWYNNYYYPGVGVYIYDRSGSRYQWNDTYRNYWQSRRSGTYSGRENWSGYRYRRR
jgi:hypothetical protein